jgi:hypothetical protein
MPTPLIGAATAKNAAEFTRAVTGRSSSDSRIPSARLGHLAAAAAAAAAATLVGCPNFAAITSADNKTNTPQVSTNAHLLGTA